MWDEELTVEVSWFDKYRNGDDEAEVLTTFTVWTPLFTTSRSPSSSWVTWLAGG